jgi:hypothetical protein
MEQRGGKWELRTVSGWLVIDEQGGGLSDTKLVSDSLAEQCGR